MDTLKTAIKNKHYRHTANSRLTSCLLPYHTTHLQTLAASKVALSNQSARNVCTADITAATSKECIDCRAYVQMWQGISTNRERVGRKLPLTTMASPPAREDVRVCGLVNCPPLGNQINFQLQLHNIHNYFPPLLNKLGNDNTPLKPLKQGPGVKIHKKEGVD